MTTAIPLFGTGHFFKVSGDGSPANPFIPQISSGPAVASFPLPGSGGNLGIASGDGTPGNPFVISVGGITVLPTVVASAALLAQTAAVTGVISYTVPANGTYRLTWSMFVTTFTSGSLTVPITWTDGDGNTHTTFLAPASSTTPTIQITFTAAGMKYGLPVVLRCQAGSTITVSTTDSAGSTYDFVVGLEYLGS